MAQRQIECWFSRLLARKGEDYITSGKLGVMEVIRGVDNIINDIINGRIEYSKYGNYLLIPVVFDTLLSYCRDKASTTAAEMYCLNYTLWSAETGKITIANTSRFPDKDPNNNQTGYPYDTMVLNNGFVTISQTMKNTIAVALREVSNEYNKFTFLRDIFESIQVTRNVYELEWATTKLKQFVRSNNRFMY